MVAHMVLVAHVCCAAFLAGVGWIVQLALYPLFRRVGATEWRGYHDAHSVALGRVIAVPWAVQGASTIAMVIRRPPEVPLWLVGIDALLAAGPVAVTALLAVPLHRQLAPAPRSDLIAALLRFNLVRTLAWTFAVLTGSAILLLAA